MIAAPEFIYKSFEVHVGGSKHSFVGFGDSARAEPKCEVTSLNTHELFWFHERN